MQLKAAFWRTDTTDTLRIDGFYDGDGRYVLRFMPTAPGEWRYRTESNVPALAGRTGSLRCVAAMTNHGPVGVRGTHAFRYADGTLYWPVGTTAYAWIHMPADVQQQTLASLEAARFNSIDDLKKLVPSLVHPDAKILSEKNHCHSLLMCACARGATECAKYLIDCGANASLKNFHGYTALHWAAFTGRPETIRLLLNSGANIESRTADGKTALHVAAFKGHRHIAEILLKRGADLNAVDARGWNCVRSAALDNQQAMVEYLYQG